MARQQATSGRNAVSIPMTDKMTLITSDSGHSAHAQPSTQPQGAAFGAGFWFFCCLARRG